MITHLYCEKTDTTDKIQRSRVNGQNELCRYSNKLATRDNYDYSVTEFITLLERIDVACT